MSRLIFAFCSVEESLIEPETMNPSAFKTNDLGSFLGHRLML
jgi:hypothetical protein